MMRQFRHDDRVCTCHQGDRHHRYQYAGRWWHSATLETPEENHRYALRWSGFNRRYADAIVALLA